jgi:hypothetical protein
VGEQKYIKRNSGNFFGSTTLFYDLTIAFCTLQSPSGISRTGNFLLARFPNILGALDDCSGAAMVKYMI